MLRRPRGGAAVEAVAEVSCSVGPGELLLILGRPGAGKTTFLECLAGLLPLSGGRVQVRGARGTCSWGAAEEAPPAARRSVGLLFQYPERQLVGRTPLEDVGWGLGGADSAYLAREGLRLAAVPERAWTAPVEQLSRGEKRRVALAGVLARRPEVLLLDEPSVGLDPGGQALVWEEVAAFRAGGGAVLVATHWPEPALLVATGVLCLDEGRQVFQGPPEHLLDAAARDRRLRGLLPFSWRLAAALEEPVNPLPGGEGWRSPARQWLRMEGGIPEPGGQAGATAPSSAAQMEATSSRNPSSRS